MNERTAEYILVPDLIRQLRSAFPTVTPFFFWASREGQAKARASYEGMVQLIACYARRPKVDWPGEPQIEITFNDLLFHHAWQLREVGIPLLAGAPCVSRLSDLQLDVRCVWFHISPEHTPSYARASVQLSDPTVTKVFPPTAPVEGPLSQDDLVQLVTARSTRVPWSEALRRLSHLRRHLIQSDYAAHQWFGRYLPYRPFYLALRQQNSA